MLSFHCWYFIDAITFDIFLDISFFFDYIFSLILLSLLLYWYCHIDFYFASFSPCISSTHFHFIIHVILPLIFQPLIFISSISFSLLIHFDSLFSLFSPPFSRHYAIDYISYWYADAIGWIFFIVLWLLILSLIDAAIDIHYISFLFHYFAWYYFAIFAIFWYDIW